MLDRTQPGEQIILKESIVNALSFLRSLHSVCHFQTLEGKKVGDASSSELKRMLQNNALLINGESVKWDEELDFPIISVVMFPKNERKRCTLF